MAKTIVILGGALAGPTAAARARELDEHARIILIERNKNVSYALCGLSYYLSGEVASMDDLNRERADFFKSVYNIEVRLQTEAMALDAKNKTVTLVNSGGNEEMQYDTLIFAQGAASVTAPGMPQAENTGFFRTLDDLAAIKQQLSSGKNFVILGGGPIGLEAADGMSRAGANVTVIEKSEDVLPGFTRSIREAARNSFGNKVKFITNSTVEQFETKDGRITAVLTAAGRVEADYVISAVGLLPRTELLQKAGARLNPDRSIVIDESCRTSLPDIFACGVCVSVPFAGRSKWMAQAAIADKTAQIAGANAAGGKMRIGPFYGSILIRLPGSVVGRTGMTWAEASEFTRNEAAVTTAIGSDREPYIAGAGRLILKLFYDSKSEKILGAEAAGPGAERKLDVCTTAIAGGLTVSQLSLLDLAYTPALGTARDCINIAGTVAKQSLSGLGESIDAEEMLKNPGKYLTLHTSQKAPGDAQQLHIPLENLRSSLDRVREAFKKSGAEKVACVSATGRRAYLASRILSQAGIHCAVVTP